MLNELTDKQKRDIVEELNFNAGVKGYETLDDSVFRVLLTAKENGNEKV